MSITTISKNPLIQVERAANQSKDVETLIPEHTTCTKQVKIVLNLITGNEQKVLPRLLSTVHHFIDAICVSDNSKDLQTQEVLIDLASKYKIPCKVTYKPWVDNFAISRNHALDVALDFTTKLDAGADWFCLFMDADDEIYDVDAKSPLVFDKSTLTKDFYYLVQNSDTTAYNHLTFARLIPRESGSALKWYCPIHEYLGLVSRAPFDYGRILGYLKSGRDGHRTTSVTQKQKFLRDAHVCEKWLVDPANEHDPDRARMEYYCIQSYRDAGYWLQVIQWCKPFVIKTDGYRQEKYEACISAIRIIEQYMPQDVNALEDRRLFIDIARFIAPLRLEAAYELLMHWDKRKLYGVAWSQLKDLKDVTTPPADSLFSDMTIYHWKFPMYLGLSAFYAGDYEEALKLFERAIMAPNLDDKIRETLFTNIGFCYTKLEEKKNRTKQEKKIFEVPLQQSAKKARRDKNKEQYQTSNVSGVDSASVVKAMTTSVAKKAAVLKEKEAKNKKRREERGKSKKHLVMA